MITILQNCVTVNASKALLLKRLAKMVLCKVLLLDGTDYDVDIDVSFSWTFSFV